MELPADEMERCWPWRTGPGAPIRTGCGGAAPPVRRARLTYRHRPGRRTRLTYRAGPVPVRSGPYRARAGGRRARSAISAGTRRVRPQTPDMELPLPQPGAQAAVPPVRGRLRHRPGGCSATGPAAPAPEASVSGTAQGAVKRAPDDLQTAYQDVINDVLPSVVQIDASEGLGSGVVYDDGGTSSPTPMWSRREEVQGQRRHRGGGAERLAGLLLPRAGPGGDQARRRAGRAEAGEIRRRGEVEVGRSCWRWARRWACPAASPRASSPPSPDREREQVGGQPGDHRQHGADVGGDQPGNSGGALVDLESRVIGIPTLAATDPQLGDSAAPGIGFRIPVSM